MNDACLELFEVRNAALMIVDMQRDFLDTGAPIEVARGRVIIPRIASLLSSFRARGLPIIHVVTLHRKDGRDWELFEPERVPQHCIEGTNGAEIIRELTPLENEFVIVKRRYSAFFETELDMVLRRLQVETLIITGITTECCIRSTSFDAYFRDYRVVIPSDCTDAQTEKKKIASLEDIADTVGDVVLSSDIIVK